MPASCEISRKPSHNAHSLGIAAGGVKPANVARRAEREPSACWIGTDALDVGTSTKLCFFTELGRRQPNASSAANWRSHHQCRRLGALGIEEALTAGAHPLSTSSTCGARRPDSWLGVALHMKRSAPTFWASFGAGPVLDFVRTLCALNASDRRGRPRRRRRDGRHLARRCPRRRRRAERRAPAPTRRRRAFSFFRDEFLPERLAAGVERKAGTR